MSRLLCRLLATSTLFALVLMPALPILRGEEPKKDDKDAVVREIKLEGLKRSEPGAGKPDKPDVITSEEELTRAFPENELRDRIAKEVDFKKQQLVFFAWAGSGRDKLEFGVYKGKKATEVTFTYERGLTRDLRRHYHLFAIPRDATWRVVTNK